MTETKKTGKRAELSFEEALERLEKIVAEMESGQLPLAESMKRFEEGAKLSDYCTRKLGETEKKIEMLVKKDEESDAEWAPCGQDQNDAENAQDEEPGESAGQGELGL